MTHLVCIRRVLCQIDSLLPFTILRDDIKSSGKFATFTRLKIEGEGVKGTLLKNFDFISKPSLHGAAHLQCHLTT